MKKGLLLFLFTLFLLSTGWSQTATVKGSVKDTVSNQNLTNTVISLLRQKDSVLYKFKRSDATGNFEIGNVKAGKYVLFVTHPTYADYTDNLEIAEGATIDVGVVKMTLYEHLLQEVIVRTKVSAIRINGDTTEFKADSFKVREGANVEEMLKKLPGIQVDKSGKITAMGEQVNKVYVDGEEFFGDDPTIATRNLQATDVDKVQVYDKKSDQATFTGIDDGQHEKAINLKLKEDKKTGYFGKLDLGSNGQNRWNNSAMVNSFRGKRKLSAYGIMSSTGKTGLDWEERGKFGSEGTPEYDEDMGYFMWTSSNEDEFANPTYYGEGVPKSWSGGLNFSDKYNGDKLSLNGSYRYNKLNTYGAGSSLVQLITGNNIFTTREYGNTFNSRQRNSLNGTYDWTLDSATSVKIKASGYTGTTNSLSHIVSQATNNLGTITNSSDRTTTSKGDNSNLVASALFRKKFNKKGRTISLNVESKRVSKEKSSSFLIA